MKKVLYFIAISAFALVSVIGLSTAHASNPAYYMVVMQAPAPTNCTPRYSDLGLGGGVFVSGTTFCEDQKSLLMIIGSLDHNYSNSYGQEDYGNYADDYSYDHDDSYDDEYDEEYDDEDLYEDEDYDQDEGEQDEDEDEEDSNRDQKSNKGSSSHSW